MTPPTLCRAAALLATTALTGALGSVAAAPAGAAPAWGAASYGPSMTATSPQSSTHTAGPAAGGPARGCPPEGSATLLRAMIEPGAMATADRVPPPGAVPTDATTNPSLILKAVKQERYRPLLERVVADDPHADLATLTDRLPPPGTGTAHGKWPHDKTGHHEASSSSESGDAVAGSTGSDRQHQADTAGGRQAGQSA